MSGSTFSLDLLRPNHIPSPSRADWPSVLYLLLFIINTLLIVGLPIGLQNCPDCSTGFLFCRAIGNDPSVCVHYAFIANVTKNQ